MTEVRTGAIQTPGSGGKKALGTTSVCFLKDGIYQLFFCFST